MTDSYAYSPYGVSASLTGNAFRFAGMRLDAESGLYYDRARYYAPALGRFLQTDPIGTSGGINLYAYVNNDPLNLTDPQGTAAEALASNPGTALEVVGTEIIGGGPEDPVADALALAEITATESAEAAGTAAVTEDGILAILIPNGEATTAAEETTTLYRAVGPDELSSFEGGGGYSPSPGGLESKYFYPTAEQASNFAANPANAQFGPFILTSTNVPTSLINPAVNSLSIATPVSLSIMTPV